MSESCKKIAKFRSNPIDKILVKSYDENYSYDYRT